MSKRTTRIGAWIVTLCMILTLFPALPAYAAEVEEVAEESAQAIAPAAEEADAAEEVAEVAEVEETAPAEEPVAADAAEEPAEPVAADPAEEVAEVAPTEQAAEPVAVAPAEEPVAAEEVAEVAEVAEVEEADAAEDAEEVAEVAEEEATDAELLAANQKITVATLDQLIEAMNNEVQYIQLQNEEHRLYLTKSLPDVKVTDFRMEIDLATCKLVDQRPTSALDKPIFNVVNGGRLLLTADDQTVGGAGEKGEITRATAYGADGAHFIAARAEGAGSTLEIEFKMLVTDGYVEALDGSKVEIRGNAVINDNFGTAVIVKGGDVTVTGNAAIFGAVGGNGSDPVNGGGVRVESGSLTLAGSATISGNAGIAYVWNSKTNAWDAVKDTGYGGGVYVANGAKFTMSGGNVANSWANDNGGGVYVAGGGTFTMSGGTIKGNFAVKNGGGVYPAKGSTMTLSSGKIGGSAVNANSAGGNGGGIYADGSLTVKGGEVSFNQTTSATATFPANNVYVVTGTKVSVPGKLNANTKVYFIVPEYEARTSKRVTYFSVDYEAYGNGAGKNDKDYYKISKFFYPDNPECAIGVYKDVNNEKKELANATVANGDVGEIAIAMNQWVHLQDMIFYALKGNDSNTNVGVQQDIYAQATDKALVIGDPYALDASYTQDYKSYWQERHPTGGDKSYGSQNRKEVTLDMHGYRLDRNLFDPENPDSENPVKDGFVIRVAPGYTLTITNDKEKVGVITGGNNLGNGGGIILEKAVASVGSGDPGTNGGVLNLITVEVKNNKAVGYTEAKVYYPGNGGGVYVDDGAKFTMDEDAQISGNTADDNGGGVYVNTNGTFTMKNTLTAGTVDATSTAPATHAIRENKALGKTANSGNGGGVYVATNGTFTMNGGTIAANNAVKEDKNSIGNGGGVYVSAGGNFTMGGKSVLKANTADTDGGGVYLNAGGLLTLNSKDMKISGNTAKRNGGGVCLSGAGSTLTMNNGVIDAGNSATLGGGVYVAPGSIANISGGAVNGNKANYGAGVYLDQRTTPAPAIGGTLNLNGGTFSGNVADKDGGGVYKTTNATFTMKGGKINDGNKAANGGGVYVASGKAGSFTMSGGEIKNNEATANGGGVYAGSPVSLSGVVQITGSKKGDKANNVFLPDIATTSAAYGTTGDKLTTVGTVQYIDASGIQASKVVGTSTVRTSIGVTIGSKNVSKNVVEDAPPIVTFTQGFYNKAVDDASYKADTLFNHKSGDIPLFTYDEYNGDLIAVTVPTGDASLEAAFVGVYNEAKQTYERHTDHVDNPNQTWRAKPIILTEKKVPLYYIKDNVLHEGYYYLYSGDLNLSAPLGINAGEDVRLCLDKKNVILNAGFTGITVNNNAQFWLVDELKDADGNPAYALDDSGKIQGGKITPANPKTFSLTGNLVTLNSAKFYMVGGAITGFTSQKSLITVETGSTFDMSGGAIALNTMKGAAVEVNATAATDGGAFKIHGYAQIINNTSTKADPNVVPKVAAVTEDYYYGGVYVKGNGGDGDKSNFWLFDNVLIYGNTNNEGTADKNNDGSTVIPRNVFLNDGSAAGDGSQVATIYIYAKMWVNEDDNRKTAVGVARPIDDTDPYFGLGANGFTFTSGYGRRNDASLDPTKIQDTMYRKHFQSEIKDVVVSGIGTGTDAELRLLKHEHNWESRIYKEGDINVLYTYCRESNGSCEYYWNGTAPDDGSLLDRIFMAMKLQYRDYTDGKWGEWQDAKDTLTLHTNNLDNAFRMVALEEHEDFRDVINDTGTHWADLLLRFCEAGKNPIAKNSWIPVSVATANPLYPDPLLNPDAKITTPGAIKDGSYTAIAFPRYAKAGEEKYSVTQLEFPFTINTKGSYDVTFKDGDTVIETKTVEEGQPVAKPADPTKDGFTFDRWFKDGAEYNFSAAVTANITLVAQWNENTPVPEVPGDFNGDGKVNMADQTAMLADFEAANQRKLSAEKLALYDLNNDGDFSMREYFQALERIDAAVPLGVTESAELLSISGNTALKKTVDDFTARLSFSRADAVAVLQAAGAAVITVDSVSAQPGKTVTVPVSISSNPGFTGFRFVVSYPQELQLKGVQQGEILSAQDGSLNFYSETNFIVGTYSQGVTANGQMFLLEFAVSEAASGRYEVGVAPVANSDENFTGMSFEPTHADYKAGGVTVRNAEEQVTVITVGEIAGQPGASVKLPVSIASNPGITGMTLDVKYDESALKLTNIEKGANLPVSNPQQLRVTNNRVRWATAPGATTPASEDGELLVLTFEILSGAKAGDYAVSMNFAANDSENFQNTAGKIPEFVAGKVTVEAPKVTLMVIWLNEDGSQLDSKTYTQGEAEPTTDKTPAKAPDADNTYTFSGWDNGTVEGNVKTYKPVFTPTAKTVYTVIWLDGDGTQLDSKTYKEGEVLPTTDKVPTKAADEQNTYTFAQWDGGTVDGNVTTYKPEFIATAILKVIWLDGDGSQLDSKTYAQGEAVPTTDKVPTKVADAQNTYVFKEWTLTADGAVRTYAPEFTAVPISAPVYTVIWLDGDDSELDRKTYHEGEPVPATDKVPTKAPDAEYTYVFKEWKLQSEVGNDRTYKPEFTAVPITASSYTVIWLNGDGTTLDSKTYQEGEAEPTTDKIPVKAEDDQNTYVFSKWDSGTVDGAVKTYKPDFTAVPKASSARTVIWLNGDGTTLDSKTYQEGEAEPTTDKTPTKTENGVALTFTGWDGGTVNGNVKTYAPQFAQPGASYTVTVEDGGTGSGTYKPGDTVYITAAPEQDNRIFADWTWSGPEGFVIPDSLSNLTSFTMPEGNVTVTPNYQGGCYVATAVYGSYDCPEVWTLRRFRDTVLAKTWYGRLFIRLYYAVSPTAVKLFGDCGWFQNFWRGRLDSMVSNLQESGFESTPYQDKAW